MDIKMDFASLRRRNKQLLVDHAFNIYTPSLENESEVKQYWIERLLDGYDINRFIQDLREGKAGTKIEKEITVRPSRSKISSIRVVNNNLIMHAGLKTQVNVCIFNNTTDIFQTTPEVPLFVAYHWYSSDGELYEFNGIRTSLPSPIKTGQQLEMSMNLTPPSEPGDYQLMPTMVHEGRCWMEEQGLDVQRVIVTVQDYDGRGLTRHALSLFKQLQAAELEVTS